MWITNWNDITLACSFFAAKNRKEIEEAAVRRTNSISISSEGTSKNKKGFCPDLLQPKNRGVIDYSGLDILTRRRQGPT